MAGSKSGSYSRHHLSSTLESVKDLVVSPLPLANELF